MKNYLSNDNNIYDKNLSISNCERISTRMVLTSLTLDKDFKGFFRNFKINKNYNRII